MTQENETALRNFEALVRQLMAAYSKERAAREALQVQLDDCRKLLAEEQARVEQSKTLKTCGGPAFSKSVAMM